MPLPSPFHAVSAVAAAALAGALLLGCNSSATREFISDNPSGNGSASGNDASGSSSGGGGSSGGTDSGGDAGRAIAEADIIQIDGSRLYALSQYGGLTIIDIGTPDHLTILGRYRTSAQPFEMYLRGNTVYAMFNGWGQYVCDTAGQNCMWQQTSRVEALDVTNAASVAKLGSFDVPGYLSDSRIVGDVLYVVSYEDGYCYNCQSTPNTTVTSLSVHDAAHIGVVDHLTFSTPDPDGYGWWKRSVTVNEDRMYVGGVDWSGNGEGHSTIQVIDISDPGGALVKGAAVTAKGQIESRWQMDEKDGVLRIISQPGTWSTAEPPILQTFQVTSAQQVTPLAELPLVLPMQERLRSVRFDGNRAFAITAVQTDPLFTFDLTDPAHPAQVGELEMPGWVYFLEPRGDRLFALGYEQNNPEGSLAVSLFDVADLAHPTMLSRVHFGGSWSYLPEDQDRIHKSFNVDAAHSTIFTPFSGWSYDNGDMYGCGSYSSGIQIIDFTTNALQKRGVAAARGESRRAFLHDDRLFGVSDAQVTIFDIDDRDHPAQKASVALSADVSQAAVTGDKVVRLSNDWWTGAARLEVVPAADPGQATPVGTLDLTALGDDPGNWCWGWSYWGARLYTRGNFVYLVRTAYDYYWSDVGYDANYAPTTAVTVIDIADPTAPVARGQIKFTLPQSYRWYGGVVSGGGDVVLSGAKLIFRSVTMPDNYNWNEDTIEQSALEIIDLSDPDHLVHSTVALPEGYGHTALIAGGGGVFTSHWAPLPNDSSKVRFYVDHLDASGEITSTNVPGSLLTRDGPSGHLVTVSYAREVHTGLTYKDCWELWGDGANWQTDDQTYYDNWDTAVGTCTGMHRTLHLVQIGSEGAEVLDDLAVDDRLGLSSVLLGDNRVFANTGYGYYYYDSSYGTTADTGPRVMVLGGIREGTLRIALVPMSNADYSYGQAVAGKKLVMDTWSPPGISVLDATDLDHLSVNRVADLDGYLYNLTVVGDQALCSLGPWGLETIDLTP